MSNDQRFQIWISAASVILTALIAGFSIAYASGVTANKVKSLEEQLTAQKQQMNESLEAVRLTVNRIDDRTRTAGEAISRLEGRLSVRP